MNNSIKYPLYNDPLFAKAKRVDDYEKLKSSYELLCHLIESKERTAMDFNIPKNPREDAIQVHEKKTFQIWKRQKSHLEEKMKILEESIKKDMENEL